MPTKTLAQKILSRFAWRFDSLSFLWYAVFTKSSPKLDQEKLLRIRQSDFTAATGLAPRCASNKFKTVSWIPAPPPDGKYRTYALADALPLLRTKHSGAAEGLLATAVDDGRTYAGGDEVLESTVRLESWLAAHVKGAQERLHHVRTSFFAGLGRGVKSATYYDESERLRLLVLRDSATLPFLITGEKSGLPHDWAAWSRQFALMHAATPALYAYQRAAA